MSEFLILIPARYESSRFPGKPLAKINGKAMIDYVTDNCLESGLDFAVVTDSDKIEEHLNLQKKNCVRVDDDVTTGSERLALAFERFYANSGYQYIINVQGDEPLLKGELIYKLMQFQKENSHFDLTTLIRPRINDEEDFVSPHIVKAAWAQDSQQCLYFSRSAIPYHRNTGELRWFQHVGVYCYRIDALKQMVSSPVSSLESMEYLEQLRAMELGLKIGAMTITDHLLGVDTPEDIQKVEGALCGKEE